MKVGDFITKGLLASQNFYKLEMTVPRDLLMDTLVKQKEPRDLIERSYNQYVCQKIYMKLPLKLLFPVISFFAAPVFLIIALVKGLFVNFIEQISVIGHFDGLTEVIPESLSSKYDIDTKHWTYNFSLSLRDLLFIICVWSRHPFSFYFVTKCLFNIAKYSDMIRKYHPEVFICHAEFSFTSSVLTEYCRRNSVKHINVMHGEKCFCLKDSFFEYDECYVWDEFYVELFRTERCAYNQFIIEVPPSLKIDKDKYKRTDCYADYKYYLWEDNRERLERIYDAFNDLRIKGKSVKFRLHPRYCDINNVSKIIPVEEIENPADVTIMESVSNTSFVVGFLTTVMAQAYYSGIPLIIDDVAYKEDFEKAREYSYMLVSKDLPLLSSVKIV